MSLVPGNNEKILDIVFKGPAILGGPNITLCGTSKSIYELLLKISPNYDPWEFPDYREKMGSMRFAKGLDFPDRAGSKLVKPGWVCTKF